MDNQMMNFLKSRLPLLSGAASQHEQALANAENEFLVMSCGSLNPRFLAKIKRCQANKEKSHHKDSTAVSS